MIKDVSLHGHVLVPDESKESGQMRRMQVGKILWTDGRGALRTSYTLIPPMNECGGESCMEVFKHDTAERWKELNLVLKEGEPGFVTDENRLKIGDGKTAWEKLPYVGEDSVVNAQTHYDFPSVGRANVIYKAQAEKTIYQWNPIGSRYEPLNTPEQDGSLDIDLINGGNANGIN